MADRINSVERRPRIVFVINSIGSGGAERVLDIVLRHAGGRATSYDMQLVLLDHAPAVRTLPALDGRYCLDARGSLILSIWRLRRLLQQLKPDLVVSFLIRANVATAFSGGRWPRILCERMHVSSHLAGRYRRAKLAALRHLLTSSYARATLVLGVSSGVSDDLVANFGVAPDQVRTINNPYELASIAIEADTAPEQPLPAEFFVAVGRLVAAKGFADLIAAYAVARPAIPLLILGDGPERAALVAQAKRAGLASEIIFLGYVANPFAIVGRSRSLLSASYNEGFPNAIAEAMALGRPVLATDCPSGPGELLGGSASVPGKVVRAKAGLLVPVGDVAALAAGIAMLDEPRLRDTLGTLASQRMQAFDVTAVTEDYWRLFDSFLAPRVATAR